MSSIFALMSDMHIGHKLALCPPTVTLDEGGTYRANKAQMWMWPVYLKFWEIVKEKRAKKFRKPKPDLSLGFVGEFRDGIYYTSQSITANEADIFKMVDEVLQPAKEVEPDQTFIWRGSRAHSGNASWFDEATANHIKDELNVQQNPDTGMYSNWELNVWIEEVLFDITHHVSMGRLPWTEAAGVVRAAEVLKARYKRDERLPDIAIRGHQHRMYDTGPVDPIDKKEKIRMITLPGWKFPDAHIMTLAQGGIPQFGGVIIEIDGENIKNVFKYKQSPRRGTAWRKK